MILESVVTLHRLEPVDGHLDIEAVKFETVTFGASSATVAQAQWPWTDCKKAAVVDGSQHKTKDQNKQKKTWILNVQTKAHVGS